MVVRPIAFRMWGGFNELRVTFRTDFPRRVRSWREMTRVGYDWGVMY